MVFHVAQSNSMCVCQQKKKEKKERIQIHITIELRTNPLQIDDAIIVNV